jgi:hypothetical protein
LDSSTKAPRRYRSMRPALVLPSPCTKVIGRSNM